VFGLKTKNAAGQSSKTTHNDGIVNLENVSKVYEGERRTAIKNVNITVKKNELVYVVDPNAAGAKNYIHRVGGNLSIILDIDLDSKISETLNEVDEVSSLMASQMATLDASNVKVIWLGWLQRFIESVGFTVVATFNPPEPLSAGDIASLLETVQSEEVALVVDTLQMDTEFGAGIASHVGVEHVVLTNFPGAIPNTETLAEMLRYNSEQLFNGTIIWQSSSTLRAERGTLQNHLTIFQITTSMGVIVILVEALLLYAKRKKK
jgi:hypothetical protein